MEPTGKRVEFLKYACGQLGLTGVEFAKERAEEAARKSWREQFDLASARAVAALPMLAEYCLPLVKVGVPLNYADYYYLEALKRKIDLEK